MFVDSHNMPKIQALLLLLLVALFTCASSSLHCVAMQSEQGTAEDLRASLGFDGKFKLGCWAPIAFEFASEFKPTTFAIKTLDGNGMPVECSGPLTGIQPGRAQGWLRVGRENAAIAISLLDEAGETILEKQIDLETDSDLVVLGSTTPILLSVSTDDTTAKNIKAIEAQLFGSECQVITLTEARQLPFSALGYQGIEAIFLTTSDLELIKSVSEKQWSAIEQWVADGGNLIFGAGKNATEVLSNPTGLARFLPGKFSGSVDVDKSFRLETYARIKKQQLLKRGDAPIAAAKISDPEGIVDLSISGNPIVIRKPFKFGKVVFSAIDFDAQPMVGWGGLKNYLMKLTSGQINLNRTLTGESESRRIIQSSHNDIVGQLIFPLEKFSKVRFINFTIVAVLIGLFILCVGPGDFFLLKKLFGKMEWTWITFSLIAIGFGMAAIWFSQSTKPRNPQINQLEVLDIDIETNSIRGNVWANIYSPTNNVCDVKMPAQSFVESEVDDARVTWMGIPGRGLGGMDAKTQAGIQLQGYRCEMLPSESNWETTSQLTGVPIKVASTKTVHLQYSTEKDLSIRSRLRMNSRGRLQGTVTNPFDVPLRDCRVLFQNSVFVVGPPLEPGASVDVVSETRERTASSYFSRRIDTESDKGGGLPWSLQEDNLDRIAEMIMFFDAASGREYTGLTHSFQPFVDLSDQLNMERAILFGTLESAGTELDVDCSSGNVEYDQTQTYVRIIYPVQ